MIELPRRSRPDINADINIVPYIDVMLVLLVIFMMTTPIIEQGVEVDLPSAPASVVDYQEQQPSIISIDSDGNYFINSMTSDGIEDLEPVSLSVAISQILARKEIYPEMQVFVRGDKKVAYEKVIEMIAILKQYGKIDKIGFMTENPN
jgi:biopolymer transport protein TolR